MKQLVLRLAGTALFIATLLMNQVIVAQPCTNPPTANAGTTSTICSNAVYTLGGSIGGSATTATWSSSGTGTFSPSTAFGTAVSYNPSAADITAGTVSLTVTTDAGDCNPAVSSMTLNISSTPLSGNYTLNGSLPASCSNFVSFASAISALNTRGVSGNVVIDVIAGQTETAPTGGFIINQCALSAGLRSGAAQTVTFQKSGGGANPKINAPAGSGATDFVFGIAGADYITMDGIDIGESGSNVSATTMMEYGYILYPCSGTDGAQNNTIKNCAVTLNKTNTNLPAGIAISTFGVTVTAASGTDSNNKIYSNTISNSYYGVYCLGLASTSPYALYDQSNEVGAVGSGNNISNFGNGTAGSSAAAGVYAKYNNNILVIGNTINSAGSPANINSIRGIFIDRAMHANSTISNNTITVAIASGPTAVTAYGIYNLSGGRKNRTSNIVNTININSNTITGCTYPSSGTGAYYSIYNSAELDGAATDSLSANTVNINSNNITNNVVSILPVSARSDSAMIEILNQWSVNTLNINGNTISGNNYTGTSNVSNRGIVTGIGYASITNWTQVTNVLNNTLSNNNSTTSVATDGGSIYNIEQELYGSNGGGAAIGSQYNVTGNTIGGSNQGTFNKAGKYRGVLAVGATNVTYDISHNKLLSVTRGSMTGSFIGFQVTAGTGINPANVSLNFDSVGTITTGGTAADAFTGVSGSSGTAGAINLNNNKIYSVTTTSISGGTFTGVISGISLVAAQTPVVIMNNNAVYNNTVSTSSGLSGNSGSFNAIQNTGNTNLTNLTMDRDSVYNNTHNAGGASMLCIQGGNVINSVISNCYVVNNTRNSTNATSNFNFTGISVNGQPTVTVSNIITNNYIRFNTSANTSAGNMNLISMGSGITASVTGNIISNNYKTGTSTNSNIWGIICAGGGITFNVSGNTIRGNGYTALTGTTASGIVYGYGSNFGSSFLNTNFTNNVVDSLFISGTATGTSTQGTIYGIYDLNAYDFSNKTYANNTISNLKINGTFNLNTVTALRTIYNANIHHNKIVTLFAGGSGATIYGMYTERGDLVTISNNYIGDLVASASTVNNALNCLYSTTLYGANVNVYNNTFRIDNTSGSGSGFGTSNINADAGVTMTLRNNILINLSSPGGGVSGSGGVAVCYRRPAIGLTSTYGIASNNNLYYAGNPSPNNLLYLEGATANATGIQTISGLQAYATGRETLSKSENPTFISTTPSAATYLHLSGTSLAESGGANITGITTDYDNDVRAGNPGYVGTGSAPDIGADEFSGTTTAPVFANVQITPTGSLCSGSAIRTVSLDISSSSGPIQTATLNYTLNGVAQTPVIMTNPSSNTWTGSIPASTPSNAVVNWSVTAVNQASVGNIYNGASYQDDYLTTYTTASTLNPAQICSGNSSLLNVATANATIGSYTLGNLSAGSTNSNLSPFRLQNFGSNAPNPQAGNKEQLLFTGAELQAAGMIAGNIYSMSYYAISTSSWPAGFVMPNFTVKMGTTAQNSLPSAIFQPDPSTIVYGPQNTPYPSVPGVWTLNFTSPYFWDGSSNILIQICNDSNTVATRVTTTISVAADLSQVYKSSYQQNAISNACASLGCTANQSGRPVITFTAAKKQDVTASFNYSWNPGAFTGSSNTVSPAATTTYSVTGTDVNGCTVTSSPVSLTVTPVPAAPTAQNSMQCGTQTPGASVTGTGSTFKWYLVSTGGTSLAGQTGSTLVNYPISLTTTFYVSETSNNCESPRSMIIAEVNSQPDPITASATSISNICPFSNNTLSVSQTGNTNTYSYTWTASPAPGSGIPISVSGNPVTIQATAGGSYVYTVTGTDAGSNCATTSTVSVSYITPPITPNPTATPATVCSGGGTTLKANAYTLTSGTITSVLSSGSSITGLQGSANQGMDVKNLSIYPITLHYIYFGAYIGAVGNTFNQSVYYKMTPVNCVPPSVSDFPSTWTFVGTAAVTPTDFLSNGVYTQIPIDLNVTIPPGATISVAFQGSFIAYQNQTGINCTSQFPVINTTDGNLGIYDGTGGNTGLGWAYGRKFLGQISYDFQVSGNYNYNWSPAINLGTPSSSITTANPATTTTYTVQVTDPTTTCSNYGTVSANITPLPPAPVVTNSSQCGAGVPSCSVSGTGSSFNWYLTSTGGTAIPNESLDHLTNFSISGTTTFYVSQVSATCEGSRAMVIQTVGNYDPIQASTISSTCFNSAITLEVTKTGNFNTYSYTWTVSPLTGSGLSGATAGDPVDGHLSVTPTAQGTYAYTVTGYDATLGCMAISTITIVVTDPPVIVSTSSSPALVCSGSADTLSAKTNVTSPFSGNIGNSTNVINGGTVGPFTTNAEDSRIQYLITASELLASGLVANSSINQISFKIITAVPTFPWNNFRISLGHTNNTALSNTWENPATQVYNANVPVTALPLQGGLVSFNISPFVWNGTSNLVMQICYSNDNSASCSACQNGGTTVQIQETATPFVSVHSYTQNDYDACGATSAGNLNVTRPNMVLSGTSPSLGAGTTNWTWTPGNLTGNPVIIHPVASQYYTVTATAAGSNCSSTQTVEVITVAPPAAPVSNGSTTQCGTQVPSASFITSGGNLNWYLSPAGNDSIPNEHGLSLISYTISSTTTFYVSETNGQCESARTPVIVNVTQPDAVAATAPATGCGNAPVALSSAQTTFGNGNTYTTFTWTATPSAGSGITGSVSGQNISVTPTTGGAFIYKVTATDAIAGCATTSTVSVTVTAPPHIDNVTSSASQVCSSNPLTLTAKTFVGGTAAATFGTQSNSLANNSGASPFAANNETNRVQYLILASELTTAGFQPGNITKLTIPLLSVSGITIGWDNYTIKMGNTSLAVFTTSAAGWEQNLTTCYGPVSITSTSIVTGNNVFAFTSPFTWNGTSNIVIDICWTNDPTNVCPSNCNPIGTVNTASSNTPFLSVHFNLTSSGTFPSMCGQTPNGQIVSTRPNFILEESYNILTAGNYSWQWNPGAINSNIANVIAPAQVPPSPYNVAYTVKATDPITSCSTTVVFNQTVYLSPSAPVGTNGAQCGSGVPTCMVSSNGGIMNWYLTSTGGTPVGGANDHGDHLTTHSINSTTTFYVSENDGVCEGPRGMVIQTVGSGADPIQATGPSSICFGLPVALSANKTGNTNASIYTYSWNANPVLGSGVPSSTPGQNITVTPTVSGTYIYTVTATDATTGCGTTATKTVSVAAPPVVPNATAVPAYVCPGSSSSLNANAAYFISASVQTPIGTTNSITNGASWFNVENTSIYPLVVHNLSVVAFTNSTQATVYYQPSPMNCSLLPDINTFTQIGTAPITGLGNNQFTLIPLNLNITIPPGQTYAFAVTVNGILYCPNGFGQCSVLGLDANLAIHDGFGGSIAQPLFARAPSVKVDYDITVGSPTYTYSWTPSGSLSNTNIQNPVATPVTSTTYSVVVTDPSTTCTSSGSVTINLGGISGTPVVTPIITSVCNSGTVSMFVNPQDSGVINTWQMSPTGSAGSWTTFGTGVGIASPVITDNTYFRVFSSCGSASDTSANVLIPVLKPEVLSSTGGLRCGSGPVNLTLTGTGNFDWYDVSASGTLLATNTATYSASVTSNTVYWVQAYIGTCFHAGRQAVNVVVNTPPIVTLAANPGTTLCGGGQVTVTASSSNDPNYSYSWSLNGGTSVLATGNTYTFTTVSNTTVNVSASDNTNGPNTGCGTIASISLVVKEQPAIPVVTPATPTICTTGGCSNLLVSNPDTGAHVYPSVGAPSTSIGTRSINGGFGEIFTVSQTLTINSVDMYFAASPGSPYSVIIIQHASPFTLMGTYTGITVHQSFGTGNADVVPLNITLPPGTYDMVMGTDPGTYDNSTGANHPYVIPGVISIDASTAPLSPSYYFYFYNWKITTPEAAVYTWNPGNANGISFNACPTATTAYTVTASFTNGCTSSAVSTVNYAPIVPPVITASGATTICPGSTVTLDAGSGYTSYEWSDGVNIVGTSQTYTAAPSATTTYTLTVGNGYCTETATQLITIQPLSPPVISANNSTVICQGTTVVLDAGTGYVSYNWSDGANVVSTAQTVSVTTGATYSVTVTDVNGCSASNSQLVTVNPVPAVPVVTPSGPVTLCDDDRDSPLILTADTTGAGPNVSLTWNDFNNTPDVNSLSVHGSDLDFVVLGNPWAFQLTVTNSFNCSSLSNMVSVTSVTCPPQNIAVNVKAFIEGYYSGNGMMDNFGSGGCLSITSGAPATDADTMRIVLVNPSNMQDVMTVAGILHTNGQMSVTIPASNISGNSYFIKLIHRNSLETWSSQPVVFTSPSTSYDFTTAQNKAFGNNMVQTFDNMGWMIYSGDISDGTLNGTGLGNQDGIIEAQDYVDMENAVAIIKIGYQYEDLTGDGIVEAADYLIMENAVSAIRFAMRP
jgi:hypothetical protein